MSRIFLVAGALAAYTHGASAANLAIVIDYSDEECTVPTGSSFIAGADQECLNYGDPMSFKLNCTDNTQLEYASTDCSGPPTQVYQGCLSWSEGGGSILSCQNISSLDYVKFDGQLGTCAEPEAKITNQYFMAGCTSKNSHSERVTVGSDNVKYEYFASVTDCSGTATDTFDVAYDECTGPIFGYSGVFVRDGAPPPVDNAPGDEPSNGSTPDSGNGSIPDSGNGSIPDSGNGSTNDSGNATAAPTSSTSRLTSFATGASMVA